MSTGNIISSTANLATEEWYVRLTSSNNPSGDVALWLEVRIEDPGPRNH